jgi:hypothetical protein
MFFYIETIPRDRDQQRLTKIAVEGKIYILSIIFYFGKNFLNVSMCGHTVWSLNLCLSMQNSPGAMHHKVLNYQRKLLPSPHPFPAPGQFLMLK